jgi:Zn-dependent protease/CBS domain-containing protein
MFGRRITLFKLLGFEVRLDASWLIIAALIVWTLAAGTFPSYYPGLSSATYLWMGVAGAILLFGSIVVHELCHSLVARRYGIPMKGITLFIFGGIAEMDEEPPSANSEFMMAIAGPLASVAIGFVFYAIEVAGRASAPLPLTGILAYLALINWLLAAFNMVPAFPLDGGRVLRALLWRHNHDLRRATRTASKIGSGFGIALMILGVWNLFFGPIVTAIWWFLIGMFLKSVAQAAYQRVVVTSTLQGEPIKKFMHTELDTVTPETTIADLVNQHIYRNHHGMLPVLSDSNRLEGYVTSDQAKNVPREEWPAHKVEEIVTPATPENTITPDTESLEALRLMERSQNTRLMVVQDGHLVAVVSMKDLMTFLATKLDLENSPDKVRAA